MPDLPDLFTETTRAAQAYQAPVLAIGLTSNGYNDWRASRAPAWREEARRCGFAAAPAAPVFLRYCLKWRGHDMWGFMAARLFVGASELWVAPGQFNGDWLPRGLTR